MKLRNAEVRELEKCVNDLNLDLQSIIQEAERYILNASNEEAMSWFESLPIETLSESLSFDAKIPRTKYSLHDMKHQFVLRKLHRLKIEELESKKMELSIARIDALLVSIESIT